MFDQYTQDIHTGNIFFEYIEDSKEIRHWPSFYNANNEIDPVLGF